MFAQNLKVIIKKKGYKLGTFPKIYLDMSSQTFGHQLKNDNLKSATIERILNVLNVTFEDVINMNVKHDSNTVQKPSINTVVNETKRDSAPTVKNPEGPTKTKPQSAPKKRNLLKGLY